MATARTAFGGLGSLGRSAQAPTVVGGTGGGRFASIRSGKMPTTKLGGSAASTPRDALAKDAARLVAAGTVEKKEPPPPAAGFTLADLARPAAMDGARPSSRAGQSSKLCGVGAGALAAGNQSKLPSATQDGNCEFFGTRATQAREASRVPQLEMVNLPMESSARTGGNRTTPRSQRAAEAGRKRTSLVGCLAAESRKSNKEDGAKPKGSLAISLKPHFGPTGGRCTTPTGSSPRNSGVSVEPPREHKMRTITATEHNLSICPTISSASGSTAVVPASQPMMERTKERSTSAIPDQAREGASQSTCYLNFDEFDVEVENGAAPTQITEWRDIPQLSELLDCLQWYNWEKPTRFQSVAVPIICRALEPTKEAKSYTLIQAQPGQGKTSALALSFLGMMPRTAKLQVVVLALDSGADLEKYLRTIGVLEPLAVSLLPGEEPEDGDLDAALGAEVIIGHPARICKMLHKATDALPLDSLSLMVIEDVLAMVSNQFVQTVCEVNQLLSMRQRTPLRYIVLSGFLSKDAKLGLRVLKGSLMRKKNMFDLCEQVNKIKQRINHYFVQAPPAEWLNLLQKLQGLIFIPRAVIFSDDDSEIDRYKKTVEVLNKQNLSQNNRKTVTNADSDELRFTCASLIDTQGQERDRVLTSFVQGQHSFLLTKSEPNIFQLSMPRVFWIIHFGVPEEKPTWYGCRLLCFDEALRRENNRIGVSVFFAPPGEKGSELGKKLERAFKFKFTDLPIDLDLSGVSEAVDMPAGPGKRYGRN